MSTARPVVPDAAVALDPATAIDAASTPDPDIATSEPDADDVLFEVDRLIGLLTSHPDADVRTSTLALLEGIDAVHRAGLTHLMGAIQSMAGDAFVNRLTADPAIRLLLMSYDLVAVDRRTLAEEALDAVRGHLHAHQVDVELVDVLGGVVSVRVHGGADTAAAAAAAAARQDIEVALRSGFLGFQELEIVTGDAPRTAPADSIFLPLQSLRRAQQPVYEDVCLADDVPPGSTRPATIGDTAVLIVNADGAYHAVRNACGESPLPLDYSTLSGTELTCSWHGCRYDVRTGHRLDWADARPEDRLRIFPVRVHDGVIQVVTGTTAVTP